VRVKSESHTDADLVPAPLPNASTPNGDTVPEQLGRGHRVRTKPKLFNPQLKGKSHDAVSHANISSVKLEVGDTYDKYYEGCGYSTRQGAMNLQLKDNPPPPKLTEEQVDAHLLGIALLTQYNLKKGRQLFGEKADVAIEKELKEIDSFETYEPLRAQDLTEKKKKEALESLFLLTEKRDDRIKGRKVAVGSKQRTYDGYDKSDGSSPTVTTDSIFLTGVIDAREGRDVACMDIGSAYLTAKNPDRINMVLRGKLAELMCRVNPELYRPYVTYSAKGIPMLYVHLSKVLYGMLKAALAFYKKLRADLEDMGFEVHPYDPCVANKKGGPVHYLLARGRS